MKRVKRRPDSVFNIYSEDMVKFLKDNSKVKDTSLRSHQVEAVLKVHEYFYPQNNHQKGRNGIALVVLPTGCGKTGVAVLASYALNASRVLVITPSSIISTQIYEAFNNFLIDTGVADAVFTEDDTEKDDEVATKRRCVSLASSGDKYEQFVEALPSIRLIKNSAEIRVGKRSMVMVVNAHKIGGKSSVRIEDIPHDHFDLVIVDEAHHYPAPTWKLLVDHFSNSRQLFLTATPEWRGKPIMDEIGIPMLPCYELKRSEAVKMGIVRDVNFDELTKGNEEYQYEVSSHEYWVYNGTIN